MVHLDVLLKWLKALLDKMILLQKLGLLAGMQEAL